MAGSEKATAEAPASPQDGSAASESAETLPGGYRFVVKTLDQVCADHLRFVLELLHWNFSQAAPALGVDRRTLYRMTQRWGIARPERHPKARATPAALIPSEAEQEAFSDAERREGEQVARDWANTDADGWPADGEVTPPLPGTLGEMFAEGAHEATQNGDTHGLVLRGRPVTNVGVFDPAVALPRPSEAPPPSPSQEFENFGHLPTLEIEK